MDATRSSAPPFPHRTDLRQGLRPRAEREIGGLSAPSPLPSPEETARYIDHTLLKADATHQEITALCEEARQHGFFSVCVNLANVPLAAHLLHGSTTRVCAVVGFPLGATSPAVKAFEASQAVRAGASEIDMVINVGALKSQDLELVAQDIEAVVAAAQGKLVKVILECALLDEREKVVACSLAKGAGAHYVKTSTGFGPGGATVADIRLMRAIVGDDVGVKASGGIRDYATARAMLEAGASRLGCSASVAIVSSQGAAPAGNSGGY